LHWEGLRAWLADGTHVLLLLLLLLLRHASHSTISLLRVLLLLLELRRVRLVLLLLLLGWCCCCCVYLRLLLLPARHHGTHTRCTWSWQQLQLTSKHTHLLPLLLQLLLLLLLWLEHHATNHVARLHCRAACRQYTHRWYSCWGYSPWQYTLHAKCTSTIHVWLLRLLLVLLLLLLLLQERPRHLLIPWLQSRASLHTSCCIVAHLLLLLQVLLPGCYSRPLLCGRLCKPKPWCCCLCCWSSTTCCCCCWWGWWWYLEYPTGLQVP
jgi:hypothetical protein